MIREEQMALPAPAVQVGHARDAIGFHGLRVDWNALARRAGAPPFLTWDWLHASWTRVTPERRPWVITARTTGGELVGVLPLSIERAGVARIARFLGDHTIGSDYLDAVAHPDFDGAIRRALWAEALRLRGELYDALELREMLAGSPSGALVEELACAAGLTVERENLYKCPYIQIDRSFAEYLKGVSRADNLKRKRKALEREAGFAIEVASAAHEVGPALEVFFDLHAKRWAADGGSQGITGPRATLFHRDVALRLAEAGELRLYTLRVGATALASVYMIGSGPRRFFYQSGYDPGHARRSPGLVLLARTIEDAFSEKATEYDFLHGTEPYKFEWASGVRETMALRLTVPNLRGRLRTIERAAASKARALGLRALGEGGYDVLRRLRRRWAE